MAQKKRFFIFGYCKVPISISPRLICGVEQENTFTVAALSSHIHILLCKTLWQRYKSVLLFFNKHAETDFYGLLF